MASGRGRSTKDRGREPKEFLTRLLSKAPPDWPVTLWFYGRSEGREQVTFRWGDDPTPVDPRLPPFLAGVEKHLRGQSWPYDGSLGLLVHFLQIGTPPPEFPEGLWPTQPVPGLTRILDAWF